MNITGVCVFIRVYWGENNCSCSQVIQSSHSDEFQVNIAIYTSLAAQVNSGPRTYSWCLTAVGDLVSSMALMNDGLECIMG